MMLWLSIVFIAGGLALLITGADFLIKGASRLAKRLGVSELVIGLTIVAIGTSAPELIVSLMAGVQGHAELTVSNVLGSNIANVLLILGLAAVIFPLRFSKAVVWKEIPFSLLALIVLFLTAGFLAPNGQNAPELTWGGGAVLLILLGIFLFYTFRMARPPETAGPESPGSLIEKKKARWLPLLIIGGLAGLTIGGRLVVAGAIDLAQGWGLAERTIGLTVIAIGTSLPELVTSAVAAYRRKSDLAVGNIIGSNVFNILLILGLSAIITPLPFYQGVGFDGLVAGGATILLFIFMFVGKPKILEKWQGAVLLASYAGYLAFILAG